MKIAFVVPEDDGQHGLREEFLQCRIFPPASLARMVGQVGKQGDVYLIDERIKPQEHDEAVDVALIFVNSYNRDRAFVLASQYRNRGSYVILTGPVLQETPEAACQHADCLFIGAGGDSLPLFLKDYHRGMARRLYMSVNKAVNRNRSLSLEGRVNGFLQGTAALSLC